jgi:hypothetical protein
MKINKSIVKTAFGIAFISLAFIGCQEMDRPELGNYPVDVNPPGGPLKFYVPFENNTTDPLKFAVDNIRAKFPSDNPLEQTAGISGKAAKGGVPKKFIAYSSANDFAATASSMTVAFWGKHGAPTQTEFAFTLTANDHWAKASMFLLLEGSVASPVMKLMVDDQKGDKWFEWVGSNSVPGIFDDQWHHLAFVYDAATSKMICYKDGVAYLSNSQWDNHGAIKFKTDKINGFRIGGSGNPNEGWMNSYTGSLDNFRLYNIPLSAAEVQKLVTEKK